MSLSHTAILILCLGLMTPCISGDAPAGQSDYPDLNLSIPPRAASASPGSTFTSQIESMALVKREAAILAEITRGNIPDFLRDLVPVEFSMSLGQTDYKVTFYVLPDYMSIGANDDHIRMPMTPMLAQRVVDLFDGILPTGKMVDLIWQASAVKLTPQPIPPSSAMVTVDVFRRHNAMVDQSRAESVGDYPLGSLVSGHKKDVVLSNRIASKPDKVIIYGWHHPDGKPIQPLYSGHINWYADYSHGIRVVLSQCMLNDTLVDIAEVLCDPLLYQLLSDEPGMMETVRYDTSRSNYP